MDAWADGICKGYVDGGLMQCLDLVSLGLSCKARAMDTRSPGRGALYQGDPVGPGYLSKFTPIRVKKISGSFSISVLFFFLSCYRSILSLHLLPPFLSLSASVLLPGPLYSFFVTDQIDRQLR